jgi:nucleotide-binding universal stress UspA family protein
MIPEIKNILYTTDLSQSARHAFGYAASIAHRYNAKITILHVLEQVSESVNVRLAYMMGDADFKELIERNVSTAKVEINERLEKLCEETSSAMPECPFVAESILVESGEPVEIILKQANKINADLIVMGTHGQGVLADVMLGSTARRVLRRSMRPVMVIRLPEER